MSGTETRTGSGRARRRVRSARAEPPTAGVQPPSGGTPYGVLWSAGMVAFVICVLAFVLWGINGAGTLLDMIAAFCG
jgi:hypothetical protein